VRATFRNLFNILNVAAFLRDRHDHAMSVMRWTLILVPLAALIGTLCAAFLWSLDAATQARFDHPWLAIFCRQVARQSPFSTIAPVSRSKRATI
jgi:hypothetical protein